MRYRVLAEDFQVEELIQLPQVAEGRYTLYRVHKVAHTTLEVQAGLAEALGCPPAAVNFPALKDRQALAEQYASVRLAGPEELRGEGWVARRVGYAPRPLRSGDLRGNRFTVVLRDLAPEEAAQLPSWLEDLAAAGLPNYLDEQRFGSYSPGQEWVGKIILRGDAAGALRAHLRQGMAGDPKEVLAFKQEVRARWGQWDALLGLAPRPSNFRSVLVFLRDHPSDWRRALNLVTPRLLSLYLAAYQSLLWNRMAGRFLRRHVGCPHEIEIAGEKLPLYGRPAADLLQEWRGLAVPMPHHRAAYAGEWQALFQQVLGEEGLQQGDLKARLLREAYLGPAKRSLLLFPQDAALLAEAPDERFPGRRQATLGFSLPPGSYATLVLRALEVKARSSAPLPEGV